MVTVAGSARRPGSSAHFGQDISFLPGLLGGVLPLTEGRPIASGHVIVARLVATVVAASLLLAGGVTAFAPQAADVVTATSSSRDPLELRGLAERSLVYDRDGEVLATLHAEENRSPIGLEDVPEEVIAAILAVEDENYYDHGGVNLQASVRALFENVQAGEIEQGGSTITMQLVKNLILTPEQDINRKVREIVHAVQLEDQMTKDEILETYLNTVYFGGGAYGVQAAAEINWGYESASELGWAEAALLAAMIRNPAGYDPIAFPDVALERRSIVFDRLEALGHITEQERRELESEPLPKERAPVLPPPEDYFVEAVKEELLRDERLGESYQERENAVFRGGLRIHTTIDSGAQLAATLARDATIPEGSDPFTAAMIGIEPSSGAIRMMLGGPGFESYKYNLTNSDGRQTGSSFKTFVLLAALENGMVPQDRIAGGGEFPNPRGAAEDNPYKMEGKGGTLTEITTSSSNGGFVRLGQIVGLDEVVEVAERAGITSLPATAASAPSTPLGVFDVTPAQMASGYSAIAYGGIRQEPYMVDRVEDADGNVLWEHEADPSRAVSRQTACLATEVLNANARYGTGTSARLESDQQVAGKTGTTNDFTDAWFVGFSPYLVTAVWMGNPDSGDPAIPENRMTNVGGIRVFGGTYPAEMFGAFNTMYHSDLPVFEFTDCESTRPGRFVKLGNENDPESCEGGSLGCLSGLGGLLEESEEEDEAEEEGTDEEPADPDPPAPPPTDPPAPPPTDPPPPEPTTTLPAPEGL